MNVVTAEDCLKILEKAINRSGLGDINLLRQRFEGGWVRKV